MLVKLSDLTPADVQNYLNYIIAPRPICFASTIDKSGNVNLSPFSFFNLFSSNPPVVIFSPARRVRDNSVKHTLENVLEVPEVVINIVTYDMVQQTSLSSCDFPKGIDEFDKSGFTKLASQLVQPPRVKESPVQLECKVLEVKPLGTGAGAGNLVIAEILLMHIDDDILSNGKIDQRKLDLVGRLGGNWYTRANAETIFEVEKPNVKIGIGIDALPDDIKHSTILSGNNLGQLANVESLPMIDATFNDATLTQIIQYFSIHAEELETEIHRHAKTLLDSGKVSEAWQVLLAVDY